jgi:periplasmic divalent cation tolerance protein
MAGDVSLGGNAIVAETALRDAMADDAPKYGMLLTTTASRDDAAKIAKALLAERLAACVQVVPIESYYSWKGTLAQEGEFLLLIKTRSALFDDVIQAIQKIHPYETPEIVATEFTAGSVDYFSWIAASTR